MKLYVVLEALDVSKLEEQVNVYFDMHYELHGFLQILTTKDGGFRYIQAMVKNK